MSMEKAVERGTRHLMHLHLRSMGETALVGANHPTADHDQNVARAAEAGHAASSTNDTARRHSGPGGDNYLG